MKINWKVRLTNPVWWAEIGAALFVPMLTALGLGWKDMTSWEAIIDVLKQAALNPVIVSATVISLWNAITDPTTKGICDSKRALCYDEPYCEDGKCEE